MGQQLSKAIAKLFGSREMRLLMLGLDAAGKTSEYSQQAGGVCRASTIMSTDHRLAILYKLKLNSDVTTIPTVGFNVETVTYKNVKFNVWDVGGQDKIRPLWRHYFSGMYNRRPPNRVIIPRKGVRISASTQILTAFFCRHPRSDLCY